MNVANAQAVYPPRPTPIIVGRDRELRRICAAHIDVPVALIYGVVGVGKSTLALAYASRWAGPVAYVKVRGELTIAGLAEAVDRALSVVRSDAPADDGERLREMWVVIERFGCLAVIDDLHLLPPAAQHLVLDTGAQALRHARMVAVSRELVPVSPGRTDRLQLRLEALDRSSARILWNRLIELYGPGHDFEPAWNRSRGNPFLLRQAHMATQHEQHPLVPFVRALRPDERRLANVFAVARRPLPRAVVSRLPLPEVVQALRTLLTRLIVDVTPDAEYQMHDLWREVITDDLGRDALQAAAADLVVALAGAPLDTLATVHETAWHLRCLGRHAEVGALLVAHGAELVRQGASADLLRELDELPPDALTADLRILRARTLARGTQIRRAYRELCGLTEVGHHAPQIWFCLASSATLAGELDHAHQVLEELADRAALDPGLRQIARLRLAWNFANRGALADARRLLDELDATELQPPSRTLPLRLFLLALEGQPARAADLATDWLRWLRGHPVELWSWQLGPVLCAMMLAAAGRFEDAEEVADRMERSLARFRPAPADSMELGWIRMTIQYERGERAAALAYFSGVQRVLDRDGHLAGAVWARAVTCRLLFLLGRRAEALAALTEVRDICDRCRTSAYDRVIDAAASEDPLSAGWLAPAPPVPLCKTGDATRASIKAVLRLVCRRSSAPGRQLPRVTIPDATDHGFDRALLALAHAVVAHQRGQHRVAAQRLRDAAAHAASVGADDEIVPRLHEALLRRAAPATGSPGPRETDHRLVIDGTHHEIRCGKRRIDLGARPVIRQLLYAFAGASSNHLTRTMIARALWEAEYDPLRHDSTLKSSIRRLRVVLAGLAEVQSEHDGYHLRLPDQAIFIPPVVAS